jgi:glycolate oxidase FAD binding subunit
MSEQFAPQSAQELADVIASGTQFDVMGLGTKQAMGRAERPSSILSLQNFAGIATYEPEELILEAGAATPISDIIALLDEREQMLAFDPPDYSYLFQSQHAGSLGGLLATGFAGSRRIRSGSVRDHVLGLSAVSGRGEIFKAGARVVKNVTGYDVPKLMAGSWGTLAAMTSIIFKVLPKPETEQTLVLRGLSNQEAVRMMSQALQSSAEVSCAAHVPGEGTYLRLEGIAVSVEARRDALVRLMPAKADVMPQAASSALWQDVRDVRALKAKDADTIWRISVPPTDCPAVAERIAAKADARFLFDWAGGLIWVAAEGLSSTIVRGAVADGHAMLFRGSANSRSAEDVFHPQATPLSALTTRVKAAMDPSAKLNPGRMYRGV